MGLATVIGKENKDSSGRQLDASMNARIQRLRTWDFRTKAHSPTQRNLINAFSVLANLKDKLGLSDAIMEKTAYIYRKAQEKRLVRGRSTSSILAAAIYAACREMGASRTLRDVAEATNVKRKGISRSYRILVLELDIKVPLVDPMKCIAKIANKAKLSEKTKRMAMHTMNELIGKKISAGKLPMGLAATVLYMSCLANDESKTQKDIADASGVTEVTIRNRFKDLKTRLSLN
jgi:transcription initiation factor TFIIB